MWSGAISFGLVSIPVKLFTAVSKKSVSFNQLDSRTMSRIRLKKVSALDGEDVPDDQIVKGYELSKDRYVVVDPDELEPLIPAATRSIEIDGFVDLTDIDPLYFDSPYYLAPDKTPKPYKLLADAMAATGKVALASFVMRGKQYLAAIRVVDGRLLLSTMHYADEVVDPAAIPELADLDGVDVSDREVKMAEQLVGSLTEDFEPDRYHDQYREQLLDLIERKASGEELVAPAASAPPPKVVDLMAALEASVREAKAARGRHPASGGAAEEPEKEAAPARARRARKSA
jgi:DNA end-binding protein Ku